jgi:PHD/YefM family antitoxin component YafN of YafNO toxin-antitoxin module
MDSIMIAISTTELRRNLRKYLNLAQKERVIIQCGKSEIYAIIPARKISDNDPCFSTPELLSALKEAEEEIAEGRVRKVKDSKQLWEDIP